MRKGLMSLAAALLAVAASGCSSSSNTYVCDFATSVGLCYEWTTANSLSSSEVSALEAACTSGGTAGTFSTGGSCPSTNRVGICTIPFPNTGIGYQWTMYSPTFTATTGQQACTAEGGTWTAG